MLSRVYGTKNLRVIDVSILPMPITAHTMPAACELKLVTTIVPMLITMFRRRRAESRRHHPGQRYHCQLVTDRGARLILRTLLTGHGTYISLLSLYACTRRKTGLLYRSGSLSLLSQ